MRKKALIKKLDKQKKENLITVSILAGMILIVAAVGIFWAHDAKAAGKTEDQINLTDVECLNTQITPQYEFTELASDAGESDLKLIAGVVPILPTSGAMKNFIVNGAAKCVPYGENGEKLDADTAACVRMIDKNDANRYVYVYVSRSDEMKVPCVYPAFNVDPYDTDDAWSSLNNFPFKFYRVTLGGMETDIYYVLFSRGGRAWRLEFTSLTRDEVVQELNEFFYSE